MRDSGCEEDDVRFCLQLHTEVHTFIIYYTNEGVDDATEG